MVPFEQVLKATNRGLSHFGKCLPILLRVVLCLLFLWYCYEFLPNAITFQARLFLWLVAGLFVVTFLSVIISTYVKYPWRNDAATPLTASPLWPFLLINLLMILLVAAMGKWEHDNGLLGFTQRWLERIGALLTGGGK